MKIHTDPSGEFAHLASTKYQRYVLYRLEHSSAAKPWKPLLGWLLTMPLGFMTNFDTYFMWMYLLFMTSIFGATLGEIYFSRVVLAFIRTSMTKQEKESQQVMAHQPA